MAATKTVVILKKNLQLLIVAVLAMAAAAAVAAAEPEARQLMMSTTAAPAPAPANISPSLEFYVQVEYAAPYYGVLIEPLNSTATASFGLMEAFNFNITSGSSNTSSQLGYVRGYAVQTSYTSSAAYYVDVEVLSYDDGKGVNGSVCFQGVVQSTATNEAVIVGGTGSFRGVRGYDIITMLEPTLYHHALYFM